MWRFLLNLRLLMFLLRFIMVPAVAFALGLLVFFLLFLALYIWGISKTLKLIGSDPILGIPLLIAEITLTVMVVFLFRLLYLKLKSKVGRFL